MSETLQERLWKLATSARNLAWLVARDAPPYADLCREAADALDAKDAEIAALREKVEWGDKSCEAWRSDYTELQATLAALRERLASAEDALRRALRFIVSCETDMHFRTEAGAVVRGHFAKWEKPDA